MTEPLHCTSRKHQEVGCDIATLMHMDTCKISQETSNVGPTGAQLPPGLPVKLQKFHRCTRTSLLCAHGLGDCISEGRSLAGHVCFGTASRLPMLYATVGQVWHGRLVPTTQKCPCQPARVLLTSRRAGHGGSAKIPKTTMRAMGPGLAWSSPAQNGQPHTSPRPHRGGICYVCPDTWHLTA